jgi:glycosyltransferase involved in cell wall biosynthesis
MIVRDVETTLPACLETVKDLVDQMGIADTGSTDGTLEVARRFGARCLSIWAAPAPASSGCVTGSRRSRRQVRFMTA